MKKSEFVQKMYQAGLAAGLTDAAARVTASQAAVESGYGKHAPGNNYFGIKAGKSWDGPTQRLWTHEVVNGQTVRVRQTFRKYDTPEDGVADRIKFMDRAFPAFSKAQTVGEAFNALQNGRFGSYATANRADYESALNHVNTRYLGGTPVPPMNIPAVGTQLDVTQMPPMPRPRPDPGALGTFGGRLPSSAMNGVDRTNTPLSQIPPDQVPQNFLGAPFPTDQTMSMLGPSRNLSQPNMMGRNVPSQPLSLGPNFAPSVNEAMGERQARRALGQNDTRVSITKTVTNPAYTKWEAQYGHGGANVSGSPDDRGIKNASGSPDERGNLPNTPPPPPKTIQVQAPTPRQRPTDTGQQPSQPTSGGKQVRLASGKLTATGTYQGKNGMSYTVSDDGNGNAVVTSNRSGGFNLGNEMNAPTLAGAFIRSQIPAALGEVGSQLGQGVDTVRQTAAGMLGGLGEQATSLGSNVASAFSGLGNMFGQPSGPAYQAGMLGRGIPSAPKPKQRSSGNGGIPSSGGGTFKGSATGREYTVGRTYQNGNGTYVAQANGTFQRI